MLSPDTGYVRPIWAHFPGSARPMNKLTIPSEPWEDFPAEVEALMNVVLTHRYQERDCGDHYVEACMCGQPDWMDKSIEKHTWRWKDHFTLEWNKVIDS